MEYIVKDGVKTPFTRDSTGAPVFKTKPVPASSTPRSKAQTKKGGDE